MRFGQYTTAKWVIMNHTLIELNPVHHPKVPKAWISLNEYLLSKGYNQMESSYYYYVFCIMLINFGQSKTFNERGYKIFY